MPVREALVAASQIDSRPVAFDNEHVVADRVMTVPMHQWHKPLDVVNFTLLFPRNDLSFADQNWLPPRRKSQALGQLEVTFSHVRDGAHEGE